jgi:EAL domain-containing protein (putative c-di-GMP-specific phosphodiesterase class I)
MLITLGVNQVMTAKNGVEASQIMAESTGEFEVLVCDLSMPEMDGVELIRRMGKAGFKGGLILMSGAEEKIISTVNKLAVLQGVRVLGQLQKPVTAAQLAILLAHTTDLPLQEMKIASGPLVLKEAITAAMAANEFTIWFQPKVDANTLKVVGLEALARWQLPNGKFIPPDSFITVAEREGLIAELSQLLVSLALTEAAKLFSAGFPLKVAINLSGTWLNDLSLPDYVLDKTIAAGMRATDVILEVTETGVMEDLTTALDVLSRLRLKGFGLSIDDFGIGYSSFEQLGRIPFTEMKLDRSFVSKGVQDAAARAILESSMDMAHKLNLATVAEGVETELDLKLVRSLGCDLIQGYLIARPMPVNDLLAWLANEKTKREHRDENNK